MAAAATWVRGRSADGDRCYHPCDLRLVRFRGVCKLPALRCAHKKTPPGEIPGRSSLWSTSGNVSSDSTLNDSDLFQVRPVDYLAKAAKKPFDTPREAEASGTGAMLGSM